MNKIFVAGAVYATDNDSLKKFDVYEKVLKEKYPKAEIVAPRHITAFKENFAAKNKKATEKQINKAMVDFDLEQVKTSSLIIADLTTPSTGMGIELGLALQREIKTIFFAKVGAGISGIVKGAFDADINYYSDLKDLENKLLNLFREFTQIKQS